MRRLHLFEWEDQPWLPRVFRDFITDHLRFSHDEAIRRPVNAEIARRLKALLDAVGTRQVVDLCAGAGGPLAAVSRILADELACPVDVVVTDLYPNAAAFGQLERESGGRVRARFQPTSALDVPADLQGVRTLFTALHHFRPEAARSILQDAVRKRAPIAVFEPLERSWRLLVLLGLGSFVRGFTHTPRVGRLTPARLLFTYVLPLAPLLFAWDGAVSVLRSYTSSEMSGLTATAGGPGYEWEVGRFETAGPFGPMPTLFVLGRPAADLP